MFLGTTGGGVPKAPLGVVPAATPSARPQASSDDPGSTSSSPPAPSRPWPPGRPPMAPPHRGSGTRGSRNRRLEGKTWIRVQGAGTAARSPPGTRRVPGQDGPG